MTRLVLTLAEVVRRAPGMLVILLLLITGGFAVASTQVTTATGDEGFAPNNPEVLAADEIAERFGGTGEEVVQILVATEGGDVISADGFEAVATIESTVDDSAVGDLRSEADGRGSVISFLDPARVALSEAPADEIDDETVASIVAEAVAGAPPEQAEQLTGLMAEGADPQAGEAEAGLVLVFLDSEALQGNDEERFQALIDAEADLAERLRAADLPAGVSAEAFSFPLLFADADEFVTEVGRLFAMAFGIITVILGFVYWLRPAAGTSRLVAGRRTVADVGLTLVAVVMTVTWMNGAATLLGPDYLGIIGGLTEMTQVIPVLLVGLGVDFAIHLTSRYREELAASPTGAVGSDVLTSKAVGGAVTTVGIALTLATATTAVGFLTNLVSPIPALRDFGVLAAVGIASAFVLTLAFVPAVRLLLDRRAERANRLPIAGFATSSRRILPGMMARTAVLAERWPFATLGVTVLLGGALGIAGFLQLETRFSFTDFVPEDSPVVATLDEIEERFGGGFGETTDVLVRDWPSTPEAHNALVDALDTLAEVDDVVAQGDRVAADSPVALLGQLLAFAHAPEGEAPPDAAPEGQPQGAAPEAAPPVEPDGLEAIAAAAADAGVDEDLRVDADADVDALYLALLDAAPEAGERVIDAGAATVTAVRVSAQTTAGEDGATELRAVLTTAFAPVAATGAEIVPTSNPIINDVIIDQLQDSQLASLAVTLAAALLLLVVTYAIRERRPALGVITIAPVALVVLWTFAAMAATNIPFGPVTATIAALAIGIGVPYTIHITHRFTEDRLRHATPGDAIRSTVRHTGGALAGSAFTTMAGFGVLVTSSLTPFRQFGLVTAFAIGFALIAATLVLPSLLILWDRWHRRGGRNGTPLQVAEPTEPPRDRRPALTR